MSEPIGTAAAANNAMSTAGADPAKLVAVPQPAPPPVMQVSPVMQAVVTGVQATQPPENWATTAAAVLQALMPVVQPAFQVSRASVRTQSEVAIGLAALEGLLQVFFPHPRA